MTLGVLFTPKVHSQDCAPPVIFTSQATTDSSVHLFWLSFSDPEVGFELTVVPDGQGPDSGSVITLSPGQRMWMVDSLLPNTRYRGFVRSLCLSDTSRWINHSFITDLQNQLDCLTDRKIPDNNCQSGGLSVAVHVPPTESGQLGIDVQLEAVHLIVEHPYPADLRIELVNPRGESVILVEHHGTIFNNFGVPGDSSCLQRTTFRPDACTSIYEAAPPFLGVYKPDMDFQSLHDGGSPVGEWQLRLCDRAADDVGSLHHVSLDFNYSSCPLPPVPQVRRHSDQQVEFFQADTGADSVLLAYRNGTGPPTHPRDSNFQWLILPSDDSIHTVSGLELNAHYEYYSYIYCEGQWLGPSCPSSFTTFCGAITKYENWTSSDSCSARCSESCELKSNLWHFPETSASWSIRRGEGPYLFTGPTNSPFPASKNPYLISSGLILECSSDIHQLRSVCLEKTNESCGLGFYYHMKGSLVGKLQLLASEDEWSTADTVFSLSGSQADEWQYAFIDLDVFPDGPFQLEFQISSPQGPFSEIALGDLFSAGLQPVLISDQLQYLDRDKDGYGDENVAIFYCGDLLPDTIAASAGDCDDANPAINPDAEDLLCSGIDENCDGLENIGHADPLTISLVDFVPPSCPDKHDGQIEISVQGGFPPYDILWNTGDSHLLIDSLPAGTYEVTASDSTGCQSVNFQFTLSAVNEVTFSFSVLARPDCFAPAGGQVELFLSGGTPPYTYEWSNGQSERLNDSLIAGPFGATVTDANGCRFESQEQVLSSANAYEITVYEIKPISCAESNDGQLLAQVQGATAPLSYQWNRGDTTRQLDQVSQGWYQLSVTDSAGCEVISDSIFVEAPSPIRLEDTSLKPQRCKGADDGEIVIQVDGGTSPYTYNWRLPKGEFYTNKNIYSAAPGAYYLTITDSKGCAFSPDSIFLDSALVARPVEVVLDSSSCPISPDGGIDLLLEDVIPPLSVRWSDGVMGDLNRSDMVPGLYLLTLINGLGCKQNIGPFEILAGQKSLPVLLSASDTLTCGTEKGVDLEGFVEEGQVPLEYHWSSGRQLVRSELLDSLTVLNPGLYSLTVTDSYGCVGAAGPIEVLGKAPIEIDSFSILNPDCPDYMNGTIEVSAKTSAPPLRYKWSNGNQNSALSNLSKGTYGVTIEDKTGCLPFEKSFNLGGPSPFEVQIDTFYQSDQVCFEYQISGGVPPYNGFWNGVFNNRNPICFDRDQAQILFEVEDVQSCGPSFLVWELSTSTDIQVSKELEVKVFPNPAKEILYIQSSSSSPLFFEVFHISGQKWDEGAISSPSFLYQMGRFPPGVYVFQFANTLGEIDYQEVIKQ